MLYTKLTSVAKNRLGVVRYFGKSSLSSLLKPSPQERRLKHSFAHQDLQEIVSTSSLDQKNLVACRKIYEEYFGKVPSDEFILNTLKQRNIVMVGNGELLLNRLYLLIGYVNPVLKQTAEKVDRSHLFRRVRLGVYELIGMGTETVNALMLGLAWVQICEEGDEQLGTGQSPDTQIPSIHAVR